MQGCNINLALYPGKHPNGSICAKSIQVSSRSLIFKRARITRKYSRKRQRRAGSASYQPW